MIIARDGDGLDLNYNITSFKGFTKMNGSNGNLAKEKTLNSVCI
jgi:hypothetical protein